LNGAAFHDSAVPTMATLFAGFCAVLIGLGRLLGFNE
jgi:hypothetical protein